LTDPALCSYIKIMYTATEDLMTAVTVGSCLRQAINWSSMFIFILMQSRTQVDTVQTVSRSILNWSHIYWSRTMKVLGSHVTFVRRESATVFTLCSHALPTSHPSWLLEIGPLVCSWGSGGALWPRFWCILTLHMTFGGTAMMKHCGNFKHRLISELSSTHFWSPCLISRHVILASGNILKHCKRNTLLHTVPFW